MTETELKINTSYEIKKIKGIKAESEKFKSDIAGLKQAAEDTSKAILDFVKACAKLKEVFITIK